MTIQDYARILREQWLVLVLAVLIGMGAAVAAFLVRPPDYTARLTLYVSSQGTDSTLAAFQGAQLSQERVTSYVELVSSRRVAEDVARKLHLDIDPDDLAERITATSGLDSVLIDVAVDDTSAESAALVANTVGDVFTALVDELERPINANLPQPVAVRVVQPAAVPTEPSSIGLPVALALGFVAGLAIGIGVALARNALDTSVKSLDVLREAAGVPNLGMIAHDGRVPRRPLTVHEEPHSPRAEAFRQLRTNLQFVDVDTPRKVVVVTSPMPSEGKSTTVANLAIALASAGTRVLVVEGDLRRPKLADLLGLERTVGLTSVLSGQVEVDDAIQSWADGTFDVLASGPLPPNPSELLASRQMRTLLADLRRRYDMVLVDSPPLLPVTDAAAMSPATDGVILVCRFRRSSRSQVEAAVAAVRAVAAPLLGTVFSMVPAGGPRAYAQYSGYYGLAPSARAAEAPTVAPTASPPPEPVAAVNGNRHSLGERR